MPGTRHDELVDQYKRATEVVRLARDRELAKINNIAHMREDTVGDAAFAGLVFIHSRKAGVGISATRGKGFLIKKTGGENRSFGDWSGPVPIEQMEMSVGITLGTSGADMIMLVTEEEVKKIASVEWETAMCIVYEDIGRRSVSIGQVGDTGVVLEGEITLIAGTKVHSEPKKMHRCYAISKGAMVDLSVGNSTMMLDTPSLRELHGEASVEDVLTSSSEGIRATSEVIEAFYQELVKAEDPKE